MTERLSALDATFLNLERDEMPMHVAGLLTFEGPVPTLAELSRHVQSRLDLIPRYRQRVREVPLRLGNPVWLDDPHFNIDYHLRHVALPPPGSTEQLSTMVSRVLDNRLDLTRPLWELWLIQGLEGDRWALLSKAHHAMIDGIAGRDIIEILLEDQPDHREGLIPDWQPAPEPGRRAVVASAITDSVSDPARTVEHLLTSISRPKELVRRSASSIVGTARSGKRLVHTEDFFTGPVGPHRRWSWLGLDLERIKRLKNFHASTVNDVLLAGITGGLRALLNARGEVLRPDAAVRTMVPVSMRPPGDDSAGNQVAALFVDLPVGQNDPRQWLVTLHSEMDRAKHSGEVLSVPTLLSAAPFVPAGLLAAGGRVAARMPQHSVGTVTTNVPGAQHPLYLMGRRLLETIPFVPLGPRVQIAFAMMSYNGGVWCGVTADYDAVPDVDLVIEGIGESITGLEREVH